ncbi:tRNA(m5U54)methyltransferase [Neophaeococcomyces mojaviensis]|uniref:tRNA(M5U54)methyltransferase n=1 Tax=Neophaeococcomyces mojaviensis TaxID=3383035 RepID=A0ACC2ZTY6_9EURO|nr:tRNA(m5U54)methyltransferase [Knufia sp. JES_112]
MKRNLQKEIARKRRKLERDGRFLPEGSNDEVIEFEVVELLSKVKLDGTNGNTQYGDKEPAVAATNSEVEQALGGFKPLSDGIANDLKPPAELGQEVELEIVQLSSTGDGLAYNGAMNHIIIVPFSVPGDRVLAKVWKWEGRHSLADFIKVIHPSHKRDGVTPQCKYFAKCSGCQLQMLPYTEQLEHKREIVRRAFQNFSGLKPEQIPEVEPTMGSPMEYGYRTKLTPHFDGPKRVRGQQRAGLQEPPVIGYNMKGKRQVMDIESCPIGTDILQQGLRIERAKVEKHFSQYKNGATILLRESTQREYGQPRENAKAPNSKETTEAKADPVSFSTFSPTQTQTDIAKPNTSIPSNPHANLLNTQLTHPTAGHPTITTTYPTHTDHKTYTSDNSALATEYVTVTIDPNTTPPQTRTYKFTNIAGSFFQNNNSILGPFTSYIYSKCLPPPTTTSTNTPENPANIKYLLDAYSGSGLFTLTLSPLFTSSLGIDVDARSISSARQNALANALPDTSCGFIDADASALFADVPYPPDQTLCVIDPPRKGCDRAFLRQLRRFGPRRVVYVSCNVHSQARDVGVLVNGFTGRDAAEEDEEGYMYKYVVESVRGFDFFPQTGHVEGVCVLNRVEMGEEGESG